MEIFYTALYHNGVVPNIYSDIDGRYRGIDMQIHSNSGHPRYTVFSLWDTYRATHPLYTLIEQNRTNDFIRTFLDHYDEGGKLPMWELASNYTYCMIGYHAVPVITDAYIKGIRDFDQKKALEAMIAASTFDELGKPLYSEMGYLPSEKEGSSVSKTLEYAYNDWCIAIMADALGEAEIAREYFVRAQNYKNILDPETKLMRPRVKERWWTPFDPHEINFNYTEANAWQYSFYVPQDIHGFADMVGGNDALEKQLDALFSADSRLTGNVQPDVSGMIGQYAHGNEPSHHIAYMYNYTGSPWKTQGLVHRIMNDLYHPTPDGLSGNEDCGQMSAWYVFSALGFYPVAPGSDHYVIGSPKVEKAEIRLENGKTFELRVLNSGEKNIYVQSLKLNGARYTKSFLLQEDIINGGLLEFTMGAEPNTDFGHVQGERPNTQIPGPKLVPAPILKKSKQAFVNFDTIVIECPLKDVSIFYTIDGSQPSVSSYGIPAENTQRYGGAIVVSESTVIRALAFHPEWGQSREIRTETLKVPRRWKIQVAHPYASFYSAGGDLGLIDFRTGSASFHYGWQGYEGHDLDVTIDFGEEIVLESLALRCLQDQNSWIFMPEEVLFYTSVNGVDFELAGQMKNTIDPRTEGVIIESFSASPDKAASHLRVVARNRAVCPEWHKGAGKKSWVFADEILVNRSW